MRGRVIVVGSVNVDLVATVDRLPAAGETVTGATFDRHPGGKGGNQAVAAARLGADVAFVGAVGDDTLAAEARSALEVEGVGVDELATVAGPTGVALILVDRHGENLIAVASGANAALTAEHVLRALERLRTGAGDVVLVGHEIPTATTAAALRAAREAGATTVLNPAPARGITRAALDSADVVVPNRGELAELSPGGGSPIDQATRVLGRPDDPPGIDAVVVTLGADGALLVRRGNAPTGVAAPAVVAVDAVGAGDAFAGALAASLADGRDLDVAVGRAVVAASLSTTKPGARGGMPTAAQLDQVLRAD
jgi:ribokinase